MKIKKYSVVTLLLLVLLLGTPQAIAKETASSGVEQERIDLFVASQQMLNEERTPPRMRVGIVMTTLGEDPEVSLGVKAEYRLDNNDKLRVVTETIYLKDESTIAGFLSVKFVEDFGRGMFPLYVGAGVGYANGIKYQVFTGVEFTKSFYAEVRYINMPGGLADKGIYLATGFQFAY